jgi:hypothetical protein
MRPYQVYINQEALVSAPRAGPPRKAVMDFIQSLTAGTGSDRRFALCTIQEQKRGGPMSTARISIYGLTPAGPGADTPRRQPAVADNLLALSVKRL